jgi:uncharacterized protein (TIGR03083 family)
MAEPTSKEALLEEIQSERERLDTTIVALTPDQMTQPGTLGEWAVKDVLAHLAEWEQLLLVWYQAGLRGENPPLPTKGYTWDQMDDLNQVIYEKYRARSLEEVLAYYRSSYQQTLEAVKAMSEEELFTPERYTWTKKNRLVDYVVPCTYEHYEWARTEMAKNLNSWR